MDSTGGGGGKGEGDLMLKPGNFFHFQSNALRKCRHLALQVDEEGVQTPPTNDIDSTIGYVVLVERHGTP